MPTYDQQAQILLFLYGGSVKAENAVGVSCMSEISMIQLVGGASLNAASFYQIVQAFAQSK